MVDSIALSSLLVLFGCASLLTKIRKKKKMNRTVYIANGLCLAMNPF